MLSQHGYSKIKLTLTTVYETGCLSNLIIFSESRLSASFVLDQYLPAVGRTNEQIANHRSLKKYR